MIELPKKSKAEAIASIERYFADHLEQRIGNIAAGAMYTFFLEEIGPSIYNLAVEDIKKSLLPRINELETRVDELDIEVREEEFQYWQKYEKVNLQAKTRK